MHAVYRFSLNIQQRCGFRKAAKKTETKKGNVEEMTETEPSEGTIHSRRGASPQVEPPAPFTPPRDFGRLVKPLVFTIGVGFHYLSLHSACDGSFVFHKIAKS